MPLHIAITRRVRPGCEVEFQQLLQQRLRHLAGHHRADHIVIKKSFALKVLQACAEGL